ncbi:hypothetical protein [Paracoccus niistensis]|uniref:Uncharacterized protein n=1 Tax=Paracoccus niistensis TaxID=632935 RepID=A0ABV6I2N6_9RHOB
MSTHPTILGEIVKQQAPDDDEKTSLDVERDLGLPGEGLGQDDSTTAQPASADADRKPGERRQRIQSE